jgi:hypothetical protein
MEGLSARDGYVVHLRPEQTALLDQLQATGLFGDSRNDVAERLIGRALEAFVKEGVCKLNNGARWLAPRTEPERMT